MAIFDTISFPQTDFVTGRPTLDGWTDNIDPGIVSHFPESGYAVGGRIAFAGGAIAPPVTFQTTQVDIASGADVGLPAAALAAGSYLVMGFFCTFDPTFDEQDGISIAIRPDFAAPAHTNARRIDLRPNSTAGAGSAGGVDTIPGAPVTYNARLNRDLFAAPTFYKGVGTNANPSDLTVDRWDDAVVNNCVAKCASWQPSAPSTNATAGQTAPSSASTVFTLTVTSVDQFPDTGNLTVPIVGNPAISVSYTGRDTGTKTFTGCRVKSGSVGGSIDTATAIQAPDNSWSVEVIIPMTAALGGAADWFDLTSHFGLYVNLFRVSQFQPAPPASPHAGFLAAQYRFPLPDAAAPVADQHFLTGFLDKKLYIGDDWYGRASILKLTGGVNDAQGVCFQNIASPASSVGVRHPGSPSPSALTQQIYGPTGAGFDNTLVAQVQNTNPTNAANNVTAQFRFGKWGNPPTAFAQWDPHNPKFTTAPGTEPNVINLAAGGGSGEIFADWPRGDVPGVYAGDTCMWVRLDSTSNAAFAQDGVRRNIIFTNLSEQEQDATVSGSGYPPGSGTHDFLLMTHVRELVAAKRGGGDIRTNVAAGHFTEGPVEEQVLGYYWVVETFRRTGLELTVAGQKMDVIDPSPGQFGAFAAHQSDGSDEFQHALWGGGLKNNGNGTYELRVPHNGEVTIHTWMGAGPVGTVKPPAGAKDDGGCLGNLLPFLKKKK
jgi:hypothetical protein